MADQKVPCNCVKQPCDCGDTSTIAPTSPNPNPSDNPSVLKQKKDEGLSNGEKWALVVGITAFLYYVIYKVNKL